MKNLLLFAAFMLFNCSLLAQKAETTMAINNKIMEISIEKVTDGYRYSFKQMNTSEPLPSYNTIDLSRDILLSFTKTAYKEINGSIPEDAETVITNKIDITFIELVAILMNENNDGPLIASMKLKETIPIYDGGSSTDYSLVPENCYIVFKDGFVEQIKIYGEVKNVKLANAQKNIDDAKKEVEKLTKDSITALSERKAAKIE